MGTPAARTGREDAVSVFDYNFFYQPFNLLFSVREGGQVVDVHEGNLGTDIIPEAVEFFRILFGIDTVEGRGRFLQEGNGLLGCRGSENPVMVAQMDDVSFLFMGSGKTFSILPEVSMADGIFSGNQGLV